MKASKLKPKSQNPTPLGSLAVYVCSERRSRSRSEETTFRGASIKVLTFMNIFDIIKI